ncbi:MAG: metallophosphoesterase [Promethearchaeota archaeon]
MIKRTFLKDLINNPLKISKFHFEEISPILHDVKSILKDENLLIDLHCTNINKETLVIGDIHGNLESLLVFIEIIEKNKPEYVIFLGDLVDRGSYQLECLILVLCLKILEPNRYYIIRGNHETLEMNQAYGFYSEFIQKFRDFEDFNKILSVYEELPVCIRINDSILCLHGGIPTDYSILNKIIGLKPREINEKINASIYQIMWNDPKEEITGFNQSYRGPGIFFFGKDVFDDFMIVNDLKYIIRAHECFIEGYKWFFNQRLLSIFSAANYRGSYFPNPASYAIIKSDEIIPKNLIIS